MDKRRATGIFALLVLAVAFATLLYFNNRPAQEPTTAFAPAESADESTPPPDAGAASADTDVAAVPVTDAAAPAEETAAAAPDSAGTVAEAPATTEPGAAPETMAAAPTAGDAAAPAAPETEVAMAAPGGDAAADAPAADAPMMAAPETVPSFDVVRVEPTGEAVIAGQAEALATVEILDGVESIATGQANDRGEWVITLDEPLPPGAHDLAVRTTSPDKTVAILSDQRVTVSVPDTGEDVLVVLNDPDEASRILQVPEAGTPADTGARASAEPAVAAGDTPATPAAPAPEEQNVAAASSTEPPAERETLPEAGTEVAAAPAGEGETETEAGTAVAATTDKASDAEKPVDAAVAETEPEAAPAGGEEAEVAAAPEESAPAAGEETEVAALPPPEPAAPAEPPPPEPAVVVAAVEADTTGALYIAGTAATPGTVRVYLDGEAVGDARPSPSGTWLIETTRDMPAGNYMVRADQLGGDGTVIARSEVPFEREVEVATLKPTVVAAAAEGAAVAVAMPEMETVIIKRGDNLWRIARSSWGKGIRWSTIYQANDDQIRNPNLIYPGQVFIMPKGDTSWVEEN